MATNESPPAQKAYRVYGTQLMYQDVEATGAKKAYRIAEEEQRFEPCESCFTLDPTVKDIETNEFIRIDSGEPHCKTCGSEIVETINGSNFRDGECGPCEYRRYTSQPGLLKACEGICGMIYRDKNNDERIEFDLYEEAELACRRAIATAYGK